MGGDVAGELSRGGVLVAEHELAQLAALLQRGRRTGAFDARPPEEWMLAAVIALGHAAGQQVAGGRMTAREAGEAYQRSVLRLLLANPSR